MSNSAKSVHSLLLPLAGMHLLVPQSVVTEIIQRPEITEITGASPWLKGVFRWRSEQVPLLSFEDMCGQSDPSAVRDSSRVVVIYALEEITGLVFYALELQGIPHPMQLTREAVIQDHTVNTVNSDTPAVASHVSVDGQNAVIPDLKSLEHMIRIQLERF